MNTKTLNEIAQGCMDGACNPCGLLLSLADAIKATEHPIELNNHPAMPVIIGHINFLYGQGIGPDDNKVNEWLNHLRTTNETKSTQLR